MRHTIGVVHQKVCPTLDYHINSRWLSLAAANNQDVFDDNCNCDQIHNDTSFPKKSKKKKGSN